MEREEVGPRPIIDVTASASSTPKGGFSFKVSLKITDKWLAAGTLAGIGIGLATLLYKDPELVTGVVRSALEGPGLQVGDISPGSLLVELIFNVKESLLSFVEDFKTKKVKQRLEQNFQKAGFEVELEVTIANDNEVYRQIESIPDAEKFLEETATPTCTIMSEYRKQWMSPVAKKAIPDAKQTAVLTHEPLLASTELPCYDVEISESNKAVSKTCEEQFMTDVAEIPKSKVQTNLIELKDVPPSTKQKGIPLCLPNNVTWDPVTGETRTTGDTRSSLYVVSAAVKKLQEIKEPVCVVSIAGPCRDGKSYILGEVFGHMEIFSIGHGMDPETVGLWMWIVPRKYKDSHGRDFTVILLDSEGISSVDTESEDDNQVFTLTVLLASMLIYNSKNVPKRRDLDDLSFIVKLSQRIRIRSKGSGRDDQEVFRHTFPFFIWLLRDVIQTLPKDCKDLNHYFSTRVFKESPTSRKDEAEKQMIAESILSFFSGFDSFSLPPPSTDPEVMQDISNSRDKLSFKFLDGVKRFESTLKKKLTPKRSINRGEYVTGEALGALVQTYTDAINDPDVMPNVEKAWDSFVKTKCSEAKAKALQIYDQVMEGHMSSRLPCDVEEILTSHGEAQLKSMELFEAETAELISAVIKEELEQLTKSIDEKVVYWKHKNASLTQTSCDDLLARLKAEHLDPVLKRVCGPDGANKVCYTEIMNGWSKIQTDFNLKAVKAKYVEADVLFKFLQSLQDDMMQYEEILKKMKGYDENLSKEKIAKAYQEKEMRGLEEHIAQLNKDKGWRKKMEMLERKKEEERNLIKEQSAADKEAWTKQMEMMKEADMNVQVQLEKQLVAAVDKEKQSDEALLQMKKELEKSKEEVEAEKEAATQKLKDIKDESAKEEL